LVFLEFDVRGSTEVQEQGSSEITFCESF